MNTKKSPPRHIVRPNRNAIMYARQKWWPSVPNAPV